VEDEPPTVPMEEEGLGQGSAEEPVSPDKIFLFEEQQFEIAEVPEGPEESEDGFATIPAGPTEEVDFDEDRSRHPRRMRRERGRGRDRAHPAETPAAAAPAAAPAAPAAGKYRTAIIVALILLALLIIAFVIWYNRSKSRAGLHGPARGAPSAVSFVKENCRV